MAILYLEDFHKYKPHIHWRTKNNSFIRMSMVLKRMGITNNIFFLALLQPELELVNPHDKNLNEITKAKILVECKLNPWYFFREVVRIPVSGDETIPFDLHRGNLAAIWTFLNDIDFGLIQPRQTGKTFGTQSIVCYYMYIMADGVDIGMFTKDADLVRDNVQRLKDIRDALPSWMVDKCGKDSDNKEGLSYFKKNNKYKTFTSAIDERGAYKQGRKQAHCDLQ